MKHALVALALVPLSATAGLVVEDEGIKPAVVVPDTPVKPVVVPVEIWRGEQGSTVRASLQQWAERAKWVLIWDAKKGADTVDYKIEAPVTFEGSFDKAAADWIRRYEKARIPLYVDIQTSQRVIYVSAGEN